MTSSPTHRQLQARVSSGAGRRAGGATQGEQGWLSLGYRRDCRGAGCGLLCGRMGEAGGGHG